MAPHSSTLAWKIPSTEEPGRLQSMGSQKVGHNWTTSLSLFTFMHWRRQRQPTPVFLPGESQGRETGGLPSMGSHRVGHDWCDLAAAADATGFICQLCILQLYWIHLLALTGFLVESLGFSINKIISLGNRDNFTSSWFECILFLFVA